jgi:hypothetical protein
MTCHCCSDPGTAYSGVDALESTKKAKLRKERKMGRLPLAGLALLLLSLAAGCNRQDTECLARLGKRAAQSADDLTATLRDSVNRNLQDVGGRTLEERVATRLRWDKGLTDAKVEVKAEGNVLEIKGTVKNQEQRRRAVELAESTTGVESVTDLLQISDPVP